MKRLLLIFILLFTATFYVSAQDEDDQDDTETVRDKMAEYIQQKLKLSDQEAKKFRPAFVQYFKEWRETIRDNRTDKLVLKQKVAELQIRYRGRFKDIIGEQKSNQVFNEQRNFITELRQLRQNRMKSRRRT